MKFKKKNTLGFLQSCLQLGRTPAIFKKVSHCYLYLYVSNFNWIAYFVNGHVQMHLKWQVIVRF